MHRAGRHRRRRANRPDRKVHPPFPNLYWKIRRPTNYRSRLIPHFAPLLLLPPGRPLARKLSLFPEHVPPLPPTSPIRRPVHQTFHAPQPQTPPPTRATPGIITLQQLRSSARPQSRKHAIPSRPFALVDNRLRHHASRKHIQRFSRGNHLPQMRTPHAPMRHLHASTWHAGS